MSIVADTLNRLQARATPSESDLLETPPSFPTPKEARPFQREIPVSSNKIWGTAIFLTMGIGCIGLGGYWLGGNLDLGLTTPPPLPLPTRHDPPIPDASAFSFPEKNFLPETPSWVNQAEHNVKRSEFPSQTRHVPWIHSEKIEPKVDPGPSPESGLPGTFEVPKPVRPIHETQETSPSLQVAQMPVHPDPGPTPSGVSATVRPMSKPPLVNTEKIQPTQAEPVQTDEVDREPVHSLSSDSGTSATSHPLLVPLEPDLPQKKVLPPTVMVRNFSSRVDLAPESEPVENPEHKQAQIGPPVTSSNPLPDAQQLIREERYQEAIELLSPLFQEPPVSWEPWFWMGTAYLGKGELEHADQFFLSGLARNDKVAQLWVQRSLVAQQQGEYQLAVHELRQAESIRADLPHIHLNMGYAYERLGNDRLANQYYGKFLQLTEGNPEFFSTRKKLFARLAPTQTPKSLSAH